MLRGARGSKGTVERYDMVDGGMVEFEMVESKVSMNKWKTTYKILRTSIGALMNLPEGAELHDSFLVKPITYTGCPFTQAIMDR